MDAARVGKEKFILGLSFLFCAVAFIGSVVAFNAYFSNSVPRSNVQFASGELGIFNSTLPELEPAGMVATSNRYSAESLVKLNIPRNPHGLSSLKFNAEGLPLPVIVRFCLSYIDPSSNARVDYYCNSANMAVNQQYSWQQSFETKVLLEPNHNYYCSVAIESLAGASFSEEAVAKVRSNCALDYSVLADTDSAVIPVAAAKISKWGIGADLINLQYSPVRNVTAVGMSAMVASNSSAGTQEFAEICAKQGLTVECVPIQKYIAGTDSIYQDASSNFTQKFSAEIPVQFTCKTNSGFLGSCEIYLWQLADSSQLKIWEVSTSNSETLDAFRIKTEDAAAICDNELYYYENETEFAKLASSNTKQANCRSLLQSLL